MSHGKKFTYEMPSFTNNPAASRHYRIGWIQGKRDPTQDKELAQWILFITGEKLPDHLEFGEWLKDGQILCALINKLVPGSISHVVTKKSFATVQNVENFIQALKEAGLRTEDCFEVMDLYEGRNLAKVSGCLTAFAELVHLHNPKVPLPRDISQ